MTEVRRAELKTADFTQGKRPTVWIIDRACTPDPSEGWVNSFADIPEDDGRGQMVILIREAQPFRMAIHEKGIAR